MEWLLEKVIELLQWLPRVVANETVKHQVGKLLNRLEVARANHRRITSYQKDNAEGDLLVAAEFRKKNKVLNDQAITLEDVLCLIREKDKRIEELETKNTDLEKKLIVLRLMRQAESKRA